MATVQLTAAATDAQSAVLSTGNYPRVLVGASSLAGAETATVEIIPPGEVDTGVVNDDNVVAVLTVALPTVILAGGPDYRVEKGATVGAGFLYYSGMAHPGS